MKIDWSVMTTVLIALVVFKILEKLFLDKAFAKIGGLIDDDEEDEGR